MRRNLQKGRLAPFLSVMFVILAILTFFQPSKCQEIEVDDQKRTSYCGLLAPTADPILKPTTIIYLFTYPPSAVGQFAFPIYGPVGALLYGGYSGFAGEGQGIVVSGALRAHVMQPDKSKWGLAVQAQWIGGGAVSQGEGQAGTVNSLQLLASSPVRAVRLNFGLALHTMPGSEFRSGWHDARNYDFANPQITLFISGEHMIRKSGSFAELIWVAVDADEGYDSLLIGLIGGKFVLGPTNIKVGTGFFIEKFGSKYTGHLLPVPPIIALTIAL